MSSLDLRQIRAIVTDADVLGRIDPAAIAAHLQRSGWFRAHERRGGAVWTRWIDDQAAKLLVPNDPTFGDYAIRMSEVLAALAITEDRSQLAVLADLYADATAVPSGVERIEAERQRQVDEGGWTADHDDQHQHGEMLEAARCYAYAALIAERHDIADWLGRYEDGRLRTPVRVHGSWPWSLDAWRPDADPISNLVKAGALIAAEIDRLQRQAQERRRSL